MQGVIIDQSDANDLIPLIEKLKDFINNGIRYSQNRWAFQIHILNSDDTIELLDAICNQMDRGVLAIFGGISQASAKSIKSFVDYHNVPFITWSNPSYKNTEDILDDNQNQAEYLNNQFILSDNKQNSIEENDATKSKPNTKKQPIKHQTKSFLFNMHPDISPVLISIIKYNQHKTIYYLYDEITGKPLFVLNKITNNKNSNLK